MKKVLKGSIVILGLCTTLLVFGRIGYHETHYNKIGTVSETKGETVTIKDSEGYTWDFFGNDFETGDTVEIEFWNNKTDLNIYDDEITKVTKIK